MRYCQNVFIMHTNQKIYLPLIEDFANETKGMYEKGYPHGIFIPYVFDRYLNSTPRIFYIGQDTRYWMEDQENFPNISGNYWFLKCYDENNLKDYLCRNQLLVTPQKLFQWNEKGTAGIFWDVVQKLHLYIRTGAFHSKLSNMSDFEKGLIGEIGYGNLNAIELKESLKKEGLWPVEDVEAYKIIKKAGRQLSLIKHILDAYSPEYLIIFNWTHNLYPFKGLELNNYNNLYVDESNSKMGVFNIKGTNTKIIWTAHPGWLRKKGYSDENIINHVVKAYISLGGFIGQK